jgi:hypothetical protein
MSRGFRLDAHHRHGFLENRPGIGTLPYRLVVLFAVPIIVSCATPVVAAVFTQNYGNFMGTTVTFVNVTESNDDSNPAAPLFGPPTPSGNSLDFNPIGFDAFATGAGGVDLTDGQLTLMIEGKTINGVKQPINNVKISEIGDTTLIGLRTPATATSVRMPIVIDIHEVDGVPINNISLSEFSNPALIAAFSPSNGNYFGGGPGPLNVQWMGMLFADINDALNKNGHGGFLRGATKISINLDNKLTATSEAGTSAQIAKKDFDFTIDVNIPEPATWGLVMLAVAIGGALARRRR